MAKRLAPDELYARFLAARVLSAATKYSRNLSPLGCTRSSTPANAAGHLECQRRSRLWCARCRANPGNEVRATEAAVTGSSRGPQWVGAGDQVSAG